MKKRLVKILALMLALLTALSLTGCAKKEKKDEPVPGEDSFSGKRIYFAAPLFSEGEREYNLKLVQLLESYGYEVFLPQRDGFLAPDLTGLTEEEKVAKIFKRDVEEVLKADIMVFLLDGRVPDEGACVELGIAYANDKRCYGIKSDARVLETDMELNPMLTGAFLKMFVELDGDALIKQLEDYLSEHNL